MAGRSSRKRGRRERRPTGTTVASAEPATTGASATATAPPASSARSHRRSSEERNAEVRATLMPLAPGERPWALRISVAVALVVAVADIAQALLGNHLKFGHTHTSVAGVVLFSVVMLVCALGMWRQRYWAVLGFMALLALVILAFTLVLITADDALRAVIAVAVIAGGGWLFIKLVRVLSRLQMPTPHGRA